MSAARVGRRAHSPLGRWLRAGTIATAAVLMTLAGTTAQAQHGAASVVEAFIGGSRYDPRLHFRTLSTARFDIHFHQREETLARRIAGFVEGVAREIDGRLGAPRGRIHVILVDQTDQSNGWATVLPYNLIELSAVPPASETIIGNTDDWLRLVFSHEYTHIVHLEKSRGWIGSLGQVFGRLPVLRPNVFLPQWQVEGIATYEESVVSGEGRVPAGDFRMILDRAAAAHRLAPLDRAGGVVDWPSGNSAYVYGAYFHDYLAGRYGAESLRRLADATSGRLPYFGSRAFRTVFGRSLGALWKDFQADTSNRLAPEPDAVSATRVTSHGFIVAAPAFSRGGRLFYSIVNPHGFPALMERPLDGSRPRQVATRYLGERISVAGNDLVFNQLEVVRHGDLQSDLFAVSMDGGDVRRLTREARAADPDVAPNGTTIVCTVQETGRRSLATLTLPGHGETGIPVPLVSDTSVEFSAPRWSPDGRSIAAERRRLGGPSEIVVVDVATRSIRPVASSESGRNVGPTWLPDGSAILFSSDRDGASFRIYAADVETGAVRRLLGTGGAAQFPAISPDGRQLVFVGYTADGYDLYSLPFDAPQWTAVLPSPVGPPVRPTSASAAAMTPPPESGPVGSPYRPWNTLAPRYWTPVIETRQDSILLGASTSGSDALGRHGYAATGTWAIPHNRPDWHLDYAYARWWPTLFAGASDTVDDWRDGTVRSRELTAGALFPFRRVRWATTALAAFHASRDVFDCPSCGPSLAATRSAMQLGWVFSTTKSFGYSISAEQGKSAGVTTEFTRRALGADGDGGAATGDVRAYFRALPRHGVVAARAGGAASWGDRPVRRVFNAAGPGPQSGGFDFGSGAIGLLRGFSPSDLFGYHAAVANIDYRFPLAWPQRGIGTLPVMLRSIHGAVFADVGHAWDVSFRAGDLRRSFGAEISADTIVGYSLPLTLTAGAAWRDDPSGRRPGWAVFARTGRAF
jgi:hypothetical protein